MCDCIFCKIINKEIKSYIIDENDKAIAFLDINPVSLAHTLVIPKVHYDNWSECDDETLSQMSILTKKVANNLLKNPYLNVRGFNYVSNQNRIAGQEIDHFHIHIIPKYHENQGLKIVFNKIDCNLDDVYNLIKK